jgi:transcriptional regulator with XRE-family HTH domain
VERMQAAVRQRIGKRIKQLREEGGLTLRALEMKANVSASYLSAVERGRSSPTSDLLVRLGYFLSVDPASFLADQD